MKDDDKSNKIKAYCKVRPGSPGQYIATDKHGVIIEPIRVGGTPEDVFAEATRLTDGNLNIIVL